MLPYVASWLPICGLAASWVCLGCVLLRLDYVLAFWQCLAASWLSRHSSIRAAMGGGESELAFIISFVVWSGCAG